MKDAKPVWTLLLLCILLTRIVRNPRSTSLVQLHFKIHCCLNSSAHSHKTSLEKMINDLGFGLFPEYFFLSSSRALPPLPTAKHGYLPALL